MLKVKSFIDRVLQLKLFKSFVDNLKAVTGKYHFTSYLNARLFAVLISLGGLLIIGFSVGAQKNEKVRTNTREILDKTQIIEKNRRMMNLDIRLNGQQNLESVIGANSPTGAMDDEAILRTANEQYKSAETGLKNLQKTVKDAEMEVSDLTASLEILRSPNGLTKPAPGYTGTDIVRNFISSNKKLYGLDERQINDLNFIGESISPDSGIRMVRVEQTVNDLAVFQTETRFILDRDGRIVRSVGAMIPNAAASESLLENLISPQEALRATMEQMNISLDAGKMELVKTARDGRRTEIIANDSNINGNVTSKLVYFPVAPGVLAPAWSQIVFSNEADWYVLTDAINGKIIWRKNIRDDVSTHEARFRVYVQADGITPADNPAPQSPTAALPGGGTQFGEIAPTIVSMLTVQSIVASPNGWIDDCPGGVCTAAQTQTIGNNTVTCMDSSPANNVCDIAAGVVLDGNGRPTGNPDIFGRDRDFLGTAMRDFQTAYLPPPQGGAGMPETGSAPTGASFRRGAVTQLFYTTNWYHDRLFELGFNEAAGNFQQTNFSGMGLGGDRVLGDAQDGSSTNNANFSTPPDGTSGRMQMFVFTNPTVDRDGGLDAEIVIHELTHGTSNRLVGNGAGLNWRVGQSLGEGWSDFYALSLLNRTNADNPDVSYATGAYATYKLIGGYLDNYVYGIRRFPYSTNNSVNPLTWADVDDITNNLSGGIATSPVNFNGGGAMEVHNAGELWALSLWEVRSRIIAANAGSVPVGNQLTMQIVTDAMKMTPISPSFTQARDALIDADCAANACANEQSIWDGFADRGLGYNSLSPLGKVFNNPNGHIAVRESFASPNLDVNTITIDDSIGNNTGFIDPNEPTNIVINLNNPWRNATKSVMSATATLSTTTPGVVIMDNSSTYPAIAAQGNASGDSFMIIAPMGAACGSAIQFSLQIDSTLGTVTRNFTVRYGMPSGTLAPVTYTSDPNPNLTIPDNNPRGIRNTLVVPDDYEIADLNFRVDSVTHAFAGDVSFLLKAPNGYGANLLGLIGGANTGGGANITNMVIDDDVTNNAANDMVQSTNANAPYTKSWQPVFNSPWTTLFGFGPTDAVSQIGRYDGSSTLGTWTLQASDQVNLDTGTLNAWSIIVTPRNFVCTPFIVVAANATVSGRIVNQNGNGVDSSVVTITDQNGEVISAPTNNFGNFRLENIQVGETYFIRVKSKQYTFPTQIVTVQEDIVDLIITANP